MMWYLIAYIIIEIIFISVFSLIVNKNDAYQQKLEDEEQLRYIKENTVKRSALPNIKTSYKSYNKLRLCYQNREDKKAN